MHLEWSRGFIHAFEKIIEEYIIDTVSEMGSSFREAHSEKARLKIQLIFTTHSPFMLSDIVQNNTIVLTRADGRVIKRNIARTFATNIQEIMDNPMFVKDSYGAHAIEVLDEVIADLNSEEENDGERRFVANKDTELKIINNVGEVFLRNKLLEMYDMKYRKAEIEEQKNYLDRHKEGINAILNNREMSNEQKIGAISRLIR